MVNQSHKGISGLITSLLIVGIVIAFGVVFFASPKLSGFILSDYPTTLISGEPFNITVTALNQYGKPFPSYKGSIHFISTDINAIIPEPGTPNNPYTFDGSEKGVQIFEGFQLISEDSSTITVSDGVKSASTNPIIISSPPKIDHFEFNPISSPQDAGLEFRIELKAIDQYGDTLTSYSGTPTLNFSGGSISPSKVTSWLNGVGTTMVSVQGAGTGLTITATDNHAIGISSQFNVKTGSGTTLTIEALWDWTLFSANTIDVTVRDQYGNIVSDYSGTVYFTSNDPLASLPRPYIFTSPNSGVHRFFGSVEFRNVTDFVLTVTDTNTPSITGSITGKTRPRRINYVGYGRADATHGDPYLYPTYPFDVYPNDLILLVVRGDSRAGPIAPAGFTLLYEPDIIGPVGQWIFYQYAGGFISGQEMMVSYAGSYSKSAVLHAFRYVALENFTEDGGFRSGSNNTILAQSVTTIDIDRLALSFVFVGRPGSTCNEIDFPFYGESGGDWITWGGRAGSGRSLFWTTEYNGIALTSALWFAEMKEAGTISGGSYTMTDPAYWGVRAFALKPIRP